MKCYIVYKSANNDPVIRVTLSVFREIILCELCLSIIDFQKGAFSKISKPLTL